MEALRLVAYQFKVAVVAAASVVVVAASSVVVEVAASVVVVVVGSGTAEQVLVDSGLRHSTGDRLADLIRTVASLGSLSLHQQQVRQGSPREQWHMRVFTPRKRTYQVRVIMTSADTVDVQVSVPENVVQAVLPE